MPDRRRGTLAAHVALGLASLLALAPIVLGVLAAFRTPADLAASSPLALPDPWTLENLADILSGRGGIGTALLVTAAAAAVLLVVQLPLSVAAAHALAVLRVPFPRATFAFVLGALMIPPTVLVVPLYFLLLSAGLAETFPGLVAPALLGSPFAVFLLRQHLRGVPRELYDAARIDGVGPFGLLRRLTLPLSRGPIAAVALITVVAQWNAFLWPSVIAGGSWPTVAVATASLHGQHQANDTLVLAAATLAIVPMVVLFAVFARPVERALAAPAPHL